MSADKKQILVCGNYGAGNLGDEAILDGLLKLISSTWPQAKVTVQSAKPNSTHRVHKVDSVYFFPAGVKSCFKFWFSTRCLNTIRALSKTDLVILGGGGLFSDEKRQEETTKAHCTRIDWTYYPCWHISRL